MLNKQKIRLKQKTVRLSREKIYVAPAMELLLSDEKHKMLFSGRLVNSFSPPHAYVALSKTLRASGKK